MLLEWTTGDCWRCDGTGLAVTWVGPIQWDGQHAPLYLCEPCLTAAERKAHRYFMQRRSDQPAPTINSRQHRPALEATSTRNAMDTTPSHNEQQPLQVVAVSFTGLGVRAHAHGRTGLAAWRIIRRRHPRVVWIAAAYGLVLLGAVALGVTSLL
ncbi:hypothetical protein [Streptomyces afghaniensis]|uniref:hypothetical protein n=1 Tax=Streptomyces afghaniensis TaxID=66865 RepID=UPI00278A7524|nr:hypothetical protein [Streptomyces afghaniensis]MDQ1019000.1 hypothetical protein [Streptomyces afghaniensis]